MIKQPNDGHALVSRIEKPGAAQIPLELLAPAGNVQIGIAAIDHGADAVYIGAPKFGARAGAGNTISEITELVRYAHMFYARVYVALNTILTDQEMPEALQIIHSVFNIGADGLILQDAGLLELDLPPIPLIASTQMHNHTPEKVKFLEDVGFKRVILARELSLTEMAEIRNQTRGELEAFVHGALCVSYSGQCYMSQAIAQRSGNRGVCAQPCRSRYTLTDGDGTVVLRDKFLLSLKDLNLITAISDLAAAGVTSFKIEGRYKDIDYVKNITAAYRIAIDRFIDTHPAYRRASAGVSTFTFSADPEKTFNRGYTNYFLFGRKEKIASMDTQKSIGQFLGIISAVRKDSFRIQNADLTNGDGLCFFTKENTLAGFRVDRIIKETVYPNTMKGLSIGTRLYRNHDHAFSRMLKKDSGARRIGIEMNFIQNNTHIHLLVKDEDGNRADHVMAALFEPARDPVRARAQIQTQLTSTGNSPYHVTEITIYPEAPGFLPLSTLNGIRRHVLEALTQIRPRHYPRHTLRLTPNTVAYPEKILDFQANVLNEYARRFYERHGAQLREPAFETLSNTTGKTVMTTRYCIRHQLGACPKSGKKTLVLKAPLRITDGHHAYRLDFDCQQCKMFVVMENTQ
ncbi:MAG: U32 family peptidase [Desulfobacterales bacterium]|nr:U32 family peptidase [Desulfobacterales bacterium]